MKLFFLLFLSSSFLSYGAITRKEYDQILDQTYSIYADIYSTYGAEFKIVRSWDNDGVNAKARITDNVWWIDMWGGYAKHPLTTQDGFTAFVCHEIGHHFGGFPFISEPGAEWASAEGQADYFAAMKCLRILWEKNDNEKAVRDKTVSHYLNERCEKAFTDLEDIYLCIRIAHAGLEMIQPIAFKPERLAFNKPNTWETTFTFVNQHPGAQCRVDTFLQAAICPVDKRINFDDKDETIGACTKKGEGARPRCWFLPSKID